jgi:hypothetical protein
MLQEPNTSASAVSVSINTAVWIVMYGEPAMRGRAALRQAELLARRHQAGHLGLGDGVSLRPHSARETSLTT